MDLKEEEILGNKITSHWYYVSKGRAMRDFLCGVRVSEVLDVGAGSGIFSRQLLDHDIAASAVCVDPNYAQERTDYSNSKPIKFVKTLDKTTQELILMMDVLEHVNDDIALLKQYSDNMPAGGQVLITVPAFQFMWSGHDDFLEHKRRYTIKSLEEVVSKAGLRPVKSRYFFGLLFPLIALMRLISKGSNKSSLKNHSAMVNKALIMVHDIERRTIFRFNKAFGLSVFCLCIKE